MPSPSEAWSAIERYLDAEWDQHDTPIAWPGLPFQPTGEMWLRPTPLFGAGIEATHELHAIVGVLQLDLFGRKNHGYGALRERAERARDLFAGRTVEGVRFGAASGPEIGADPAWLHLIVRVPFEVDEAR